MILKFVSGPIDKLSKSLMETESLCSFAVFRDWKNYFTLTLNKTFEKDFRKMMAGTSLLLARSSENHKWSKETVRGSLFPISLTSIQYESKH